MAEKVVLTFGRDWKVHKISIGAVALLLLTSLSQGSSAENSPVASSQLSLKHKVDSNISVRVSESIKDTRTTVRNSMDEVTNHAHYNDIVITPTETIGNSSYKSRGEDALETKAFTDGENHLTGDENDILKSDFRNIGGIKSTSISRNYYEAIEPTKIGHVGEGKISQTVKAVPGEAEGVSMNRSRPRASPEKKIYSKEDREAAKELAAVSKKWYTERPPKYLEKQRLGKNYIQMEKALGKIARVALREENEETTTGIQTRRGREDEDRKASPDIQDIITGIVKILNGKNSGHSEGSTGRPLRPTGTRINNRGPPRISDVPPLDFDTPPSFVPLPPPPPKRVSPPYPVDIPPSMPNIPLPPQPQKPGHSSLPSHPFIDGVPIPEIVVPGEHKTPNRVNPVYDTISVSVPQSSNSYQYPSLTDRPPPTDNATKVTAATFQPLETHPPVKTVTSSPKPDKNKATTQKTITPNFGDKSVTKRIRQRPRPNNGTRFTTKPVIQMKNVTVVLRTTTEEAKTTIPTSEAPADAAAQETITKEEARPLEQQPNGTSTSTTEASTEADVVESTTDRVPSVEDKFPIQESAVGIGEATPVLESSLPEAAVELVRTSTPSLTSSSTQSASTTHEYKVRPGIVLDDPEYKPVGHKHPLLSQRPIITAPPPHTHYGEIFDVTVHAVQGPGGDTSLGKPFIYPVDVGGHQNQKEVAVITKPEQGQDFVSIDGKRTYINLFGETTSKPSPSATQPPTIAGTGFPTVHKEAPVKQNRPLPSTPPSRIPYRRPSHPPVRIDTCIVGDDTTCDSAQNEMCRTEDGVSSCHCRPGYNRRKHRDTCRRVVSMLTSMRVDKLYDRKVIWRDTLGDPDSDDYHQLSYEASQAIESAMSMTPFSDDFINSRINSIYAGKNLETNEPAVYINMTIQLEENLDTVRPAVRHDIQRHLLRVIQRRNNNVGNSAVWVDSAPGSILAFQDVDECSSAELHDCHQRAICSNTFGGFKCQCPEGSRDAWVGNVHRQGRHCETCSSEYCSNRGECRFEQGQQICHCSGSFYGAQCEVDGEVLGVAIGASVAAAIIIVLTLVCLCMWSRKWSREQKSAIGVGMGSPVFGYMATGPAVKTPNVGGPPYQVSIEDRIRWAQIADVMAQANHYAQPEPGNGGTRSSFSGYPSLPQAHTLSMKGTLPVSTVAPPVPLPRLSLPSKTTKSAYGAFSQQGTLHQRTNAVRTSLDTTSSSEEEDRADLLGRNFQAPRPKSRTSVANQSGIYYDVEYDRSDIYSKQNTIPMNTYTLNPQHQVRSFFR